MFRSVSSISVIPDYGIGQGAGGAKGKAKSRPKKKKIPTT